VTFTFELDLNGVSISEVILLISFCLDTHPTNCFMWTTILSDAENSTVTESEMDTEVDTDRESVVDR